MGTTHPRRPTLPMDDIDELTADRDDVAREPDPYYLVIPDDVWQSEEPTESNPREDERAEEDEVDYDHEREQPRSISRAAATGLGGLAVSLVAGVVPSLVVGPPAALVAGVAAGIFGGLMGSSLAAEAYDRKHGADEL
jgi:hypothetical protein